MSRPYPTHTRLGQRMSALGLKKYNVCGACSLSDRLLTEYLAGRARISPINRVYLAKFLDVSPEWLQPTGSELETV